MTTKQMMRAVGQGMFVGLTGDTSRARSMRVALETAMRRRRIATESLRARAPRENGATGSSSN